MALGQETALHWSFLRPSMCGKCVMADYQGNITLSNHSHVAAAFGIGQGRFPAEKFSSLDDLCAQALQTFSPRVPREGAMSDDARQLGTSSRAGRATGRSLCATFRGAGCRIGVLDERTGLPPRAGRLLRSR